MNNNEFFNIKITESLEKAMDNAIDKGIERASSEIKPKKIKKRKIAIGITAACISFVVSFGVINPAFAAKLPIIGTVFKAIEKNIEFPGDYSQYATSLNEVVSDNGIKITLSDILCDGEELYVTYKVESKEPFRYEKEGDEPLDSDQLLENEASHKVSFSEKELVMDAIGGLDGKFIDEHTFIGMKKYYLKFLDKEIPDSFNFEVKITSIGTHVFYNNPKNQFFYGNWAFKVPVKVDKSISKNINVNYKTDNGFSLESIIITPFNVVINSTTPDYEYYDMKVIDDNNRELDFTNSGSLNDNKKITYFNALPKDCKSLRVIIYRDKLEEKETIKNLDGSSETTYEDVGNEIFLDKTISIE
ncbi:DUF4179 domain-containing protein [Clostridium weizhouense]|uniref:DUF4179 domain-containing protein n=1 Tax=Clostridium weizhouense TaxID=2859781 RepID=A0ABS7ANC5_9CLOT|nr:DUF4179 domain-containing protein [Clostridium weizhouense]MBW6410170.1 DUF4179 domain-containing protein [Clostridium weizhouense]